jgi:glycosyltransferase involved in cell wall biosynthesis
MLVVDGSGEAHAAPVVADADDVRFLAPDMEISVTEARNRGIERATGEYVQLLDDDDQVTNDKFSKQVAVLEEKPAVGVVYSGGTYTSCETFSPNPSAHGEVLREALMLELYSCITSTMLVERDVLLEIHPLPETSGADDTHWKVELAKRTAFDYVDESLVLKHVDADSRGKDVGNVRSLESFFKTYDDLYKQFPPEVRRTAQANYFKYRASICLSNRRWSPTAIYAYGMAFRKRPLLGHLGLFLASFLGRQGVSTVQSL